MLQDRILSTLKFFDLQDYPLTLLELKRFLISDVEGLRHKIDGQGEIVNLDSGPEAQASIDEILKCLDIELKGRVENIFGFYYLLGRSGIAHARLHNYFFGIKREKLIRKFVKFLKFIPYVRGVALAGSQAMGQQKDSSDIDLFIITDRKFMWLARTLVTVYFQFLGVRRHGEKITNRFCLNHYVSGPKKINHLKNLYTASEYLKLRPLLYKSGISDFQMNNLDWLRQFFPNVKLFSEEHQNQSKLQSAIETVLNLRLGSVLEKLFKNWQLPKIRKEKFIVVENDELSFHPDSKQKVLLEKFFFE